MNNHLAITENEKNKEVKASRLLSISVRILFAVAVVGQLIFVYHILAAYWATAMSGQWEKWNDGLYNGFMEGDPVGNFFLIVHILLAAVITFGGPIQFITPIRNHFPKFHRWNGQIYLVTAFLISLAGLYMVHSRGVIGGPLMATGNTINATFIIIAAGMAWRTALARDFVAHRRWAIRTFIVVSGVWFIRIGYGLWLFLNAGNFPGSTENMTGPFDQFLAIAHTLLPLAILEFYFFIRSRESALKKYVLAAGFLVLSLLLGAGIFMATMIFWMPG